MSTDRLTEILNYLSAMSRDIGEFRQETTARLSGLESRMTGLEGRMENLETEVRTGFEQVRKDIRLLTREVEILNNTTLHLQAGQRDLEVRVEVLEKKADLA